jgi:hypothetical protein
MRGYFGHIAYGTYPINLVAGPLTLCKMAGMVRFELTLKQVRSLCDFPVADIPVNFGGMYRVRSGSLHSDSVALSPFKLTPHKISFL